MICVINTAFYRPNFTNGTVAFNNHRKNDVEKRKITELEDEIRYKDGVIVELLQEHMTILGENKWVVG